MKKENLSVVWLFIRIYGIALSIFTLFRVVLFAVEFNRIGNASLMEVFTSFLMGLRFDMVISSYILFLPFLFLSVHTLFSDVGRRTLNIVFLYLFVLFSLAFIVCAADIPYFSQFFSRFSYSAFDWFDTPDFVFKMIFQEPRYWAYTILFITLNLSFYFLMRRIFNRVILLKCNKQLFLSIPQYIVCLGVIFLGIRGRLEEKSPIKVGTAYFSNNSFLNQLGLNPNFTLIRSCLDSKKDKVVNFMDNEVAVKTLQAYIGVAEPSPFHPLLKKEPCLNENIQKHNVVIIIMEGMSAYYLKKHGNTENLVPFLDSISNTGYYFENCYTAGIHTHNGIFSTLFSYPALAGQHSMKESNMKQYDGIASTLKENNYSTIYFTTHDGQFDNVEGFLKNNQFETVISKKNYPRKKVKTTLGVPDDFMFEFSIPTLNELHNKGKPFLSVFMTASNHGPYYQPEYFQSKNPVLKKRMIEYSDWSIKKFITLAQSEPWFDNTIFVFIADHGAPIRSTYDISLDYVYTPLIFFAPSIITENKTFNKLAGQIDVFPSIMGLLNMEFDNSTMGINLFRDSRPYIFFNSHDKYGVIGKEWLLILYGDHSTGLYNYVSSDKINYADKMPAVAEKMRTYLFAHIQTYQFLIRQSN